MLKKNLKKKPKKLFFKYVIFKQNLLKNFNKFLVFNKTFQKEEIKKEYKNCEIFI